MFSQYTQPKEGTTEKVNNFFSAEMYNQLEQHFFAFSFIIERPTEKLLQLIMPLKSIYNQNLGFD
jgi:hypothetical protein